jgi:hypothetical protein
MAYIAPTTKSTGTLITAAVWNADVVANEIAIYAGGLSIASQAIGDILYASSTTQFARVAAVAAGQVLTSAGTGTVPAYSATPALTSVDMGGTTVYGSRAITVDTGGVLNIALASSAGDDFTVDTDKLVVSGDTGYVGLGTAAPISLLDVRGPVGTGATPAGLLTLATNELTVVKADQLGRINFQAPLESSGTDAILNSASIHAEARDTFSATVNSTDLVFSTASTTTPVEALRIRHDGDIYSDVDGATYERGWYNYISSSTVVGFSSYVAGRYFIMIKTLGNTCWVNYYIEGVSNSTETSFTLPHTAINYGAAFGFHTAMGFTYDNSVYKTPGRCNLSFNDTKVWLYMTYPGGTTWTASGSKVVGGQFFYQFGEAP